MNEKRTGKCLRQIINGEIKQTQLGITCIASIQYHTQYISINIHSTKYQHNYKISIFWQKSSAKPKAAKKGKIYLLKKIDLYPIFSFLLQTLLPKCIKIMKRKRKSTQDVFRSRVDPGKGNSIIFWMTVP